MSWRRKIQNIRPSWRALVFLWREEVSFRVLVICAFIVSGFAYIVGVTKTEFIILLLTIGTVLSIEALNTALEELCDHVTPEQHHQIGKVKDIASGATLIMLCTALVLGCIIFVPHITTLL